ncbi:Ras- protein Rab-14 [Coemansia sp. RSA 1365]|nr:Ras- protein Rab-14 [Coemansia sp. RSA 1365]
MVAIYNYSYIAKFIFIGDMGCGKSSLLRKFTEGDFSERTNHTIGVEFGTKIIEVERFRSVTRSYYRGSIGTILVYDITNRESFEDLDKWMVDAQQLTPTHSIFVLVGNKADREQLREVDYKEGEAYAKKNGMVFFEASAKTGEKVDTIFYDLVSQILSMVNNGTVDPALPDSGVQCMKPQHSRASTSSTSGTQPVNVGNRSNARFSIGSTSCC